MGISEYERVAQAIRFLEEHAAEQPSLDTVARHVGLSPFHFQRLFKRWAGVSPKRYLQHLTIEAARQHLRASASVLAATYAAGLSGPGRLHDLFVAVEAVTPGQFKQRGDGLVLRYGFRPTPFGECLAALSERGICSLRFLEAGRRAEAAGELQREWRAARMLEDLPAVAGVVDAIFAPARRQPDTPLHLLLRGTNFQLKVWQALLQIPEGAVISYSALAAWLGAPSATRAVAGAVARNPIAYLIPCHRVLRSSGEIGGYRWDPVRKRAILAREFVTPRPVSTGATGQRAG